MQRLNIPLKSGHNTTRPSRRVVWPIFVTGCLALVALGLVSVLLGRTTLAAGALPEGEWVNLVGRRSLTIVSEHLGDVPILKNTPITLKTILPFAKREVLVEVMPDGRRLVAFIGKLEDHQVKMFQDYGVFVHTFDRVVVLTDTEVPISGWSRGLGWHVGALSPAYGGSARVDNRGFSLNVQQSGLFFWRFGHLWPFDGKVEVLPETTIARVVFSGEQDIFSAYLSSLFAVGIQEAMSELLFERSGELILTEDAEGLGYSLRVDGAPETQNLAKIMQTSLALQAPTTKAVTLPDGTRIDEMAVSVDSQQVSIEETAMGVVIRASSDVSKIIGLIEGDVAVLTNRETLLAPPDRQNRFKHHCGMDQTFLLPTAIAGLVGDELVSMHTGLSWWKKISYIGISKGHLSVCW